MFSPSLWTCKKSQTRVLAKSSQRRVGRQTWPSALYGKRDRGSTVCHSPCRSRRRCEVQKTGDCNKKGAQCLLLRLRHRGSRSSTNGLLSAFNRWDKCKRAYRCRSTRIRHPHRQRRPPHRTVAKWRDSGRAGSLGTCKEKRCADSLAGKYARQHDDAHVGLPIYGQCGARDLCDVDEDFCLSNCVGIPSCKIRHWRIS